MKRLPTRLSNVPPRFPFTRKKGQLLGVTPLIAETITHVQR
jgi:hypothetical protein